MFYLYNIRYFILFLLLAFISTSCKKEEDFAEEQEAQILNYLRDNNIENYQRDNHTGIYYYFTTHPNSISPSKNSDIEIRVEGRLLDQTVFLSEQTMKVKLSETIIGWQLILPHFTIGTQGVLIIPSRFAYGKKGLDTIVPSHSIVLFDIKELINIHPFF